MEKRSIISFAAAAFGLLTATGADAGGISGAFAGAVTSSERTLYGDAIAIGQPVTGTFATHFTACEAIPDTGSECFVPQLSVIFDVAGQHYDFSRAYWFPSSFNFTDNAAGQTLSLSPDNGDPHGIVILNLVGPANAFIDNGDPLTLHGGPVFASASTLFIASRLIVATMQLTSVQVDGVAGVPEPATWALIVTGFGLTGLGMRARRRPRLSGSY